MLSKDSIGCGLFGLETLRQGCFSKTVEMYHKRDRSSNNTFSVFIQCIGCAIIVSVGADLNRVGDWQMRKSKTVVLDGNQYCWNGKRWFNKITYLEPPTAISSKLTSMITKQITAQDEKIADVDALLRKAKKAHYRGEIPKALMLARKAYHQRPQHRGTVVTLCSVLRTANKSREAVDVTSSFRSSHDSPILTSRAAALCDLNRWDDALKQIRQVFAMRRKSRTSSGTEEALAVYRRIKQNASYLFDEQRLK